MYPPFLSKSLIYFLLVSILSSGSVTEARSIANVANFPAFLGEYQEGQRDWRVSYGTGCSHLPPCCRRGQMSYFVCHVRCWRKRDHCAVYGFGMFAKAPFFDNQPEGNICDSASRHRRTTFLLNWQSRLSLHLLTYTWMRKRWPVRKNRHSLWLAFSKSSVSVFCVFFLWRCFFREGKINWLNAHRFM